MTTKLAARDIAELDPYKVMATIGKRVIHPGDRTSTEVPLERAAVTMFVDREKAAGELARVAKPGARVLATEFFWREPPSAEAREIFLGQVCPGLEFDTETDWIRIYETGGLTGLATETGPFDMMTPRGFLSDEGFLHPLAIMGRVATRPANMKKMTWLMPVWPRPSRTSATSS